MKRYIFVALLLPGFVFANTVSFSELWKSIYNQSKVKEAAQAQIEASQLESSRASRHWLPQLYVDAKGYRTNEPGSSLFSLLQQGAVEAADFNPASLNNPQEDTYIRAALGVQWPLFEGGMKWAQSGLKQSLAEAQDYEAKQMQIDLYAQVATAYMKVGYLNQNIKKLKDIQTQVQNITKNFRLGNQSNPVGHAGYLGLKSLDNRVQGFIAQYESQLKGYYIALKELGFNQDNWVAADENSIKFVENKLSVDNKIDNKSYKIESMKLNAKAADLAADMQRARFLPHVGLFAETYTFSGDRAQDNGYMAGAYLRWNLFDPNDFGILKESRLKAVAAEKMSQALNQKDNAEKAAYTEAQKALKENLKLMALSEDHLAEQQKSVITLFRNGSVNVLQLAEVLNRRVDLISQHIEAQDNLLKVSSEIVLKSSFNYSQGL